MCVVKSYKIFKLALNNYDIKQHVLTVKIHAFGWFFWNVCLAERYITQRLRKHFKLDFERQTVTEKGLPKQLRKMCKSCSLSVSHTHIIFNIECRAKSLLQVMNISHFSTFMMIRNIAFVGTMMPNIITKHIRYKSYLKYFLKRDWIQRTNALKAEKCNAAWNKLYLTI